MNMEFSDAFKFIMKSSIWFESMISNRRKSLFLDLTNKESELDETISKFIYI